MEDAFISFFAPNLIAATINGAIALLLFMTIVAASKDIRRYGDIEKDALLKVQKKVQSWISNLLHTTKSEGKTKSKKKESEFPDLLMDIDEIKKGIPNDTIIYKRIDTIAKMRQYRVKVNVDALQQATITSEASKLGVSLPAFATSLSMILGLFGTFIGLTLLVNKISLLLPNTSQGEITVTSLMTAISDMEIVFQGIKTAFSTSIAGIFTAMICLTTNFRLRKIQTSFFHELESFTVSQLIPVTVPAVEEAHLLEQVSFELKDSFNQISNIISQNNKTLEELNTIEESFKTIVGEIRAITKREETRNLETVLGLLTQTNNSITNIVNQWPEVVKLMKENSNSMQAKIERLIESIKKQERVFEKEINRIIRVRRGGFVLYFPTIRNYTILVGLSIIVGFILYLTF